MCHKKGFGQNVVKENDGAFIVGLNWKCVTKSEPIFCQTIVIENDGAFIIGFNWKCVTNSGPIGAIKNGGAYYNWKYVS